MQDYRNSLILPKTDFPMKGNLAQKEPKRYEEWSKFAYSKMSSRNSQNTFGLHDGPPYANGHLHVGHALNKILKDFIVKYHYFSGKRISYVPGWDCHGLPIEQQVSMKLQDSESNITEIRKKCREHAQNFVEIQSKEFQSLGIIGDFENPYKTMDYKFEANIYRSLVNVAKNGLLVQRSKPIFWSWSARSALAEAEVEYKDKKSDSIFVKFNLSNDAKRALKIESLKTENEPFVVIWTTTPWTLPSNVAIALKPNEKYVLTKQGAIVAKERFNGLTQRGLINSEVILELDSSSFENLIAINPLNDRESLLILADYVSLEDGTGLVHNAPGHGEDDYFACLKYNLPIIMPVDDGGHFDENILKHKLFKSDVLSEIVGMHIFKAQKKILEILQNVGALLFHEEITHSYPHCWRTNKPVIFRATKQWFISMDKPYHNGKTLREVALDEIEKVRFYPENGRNRLKTMVQNRPDWCISRQRDWGVPIAFFIDKQSGEPLLDSEVTTFIANLFEKHGCDIWWEKEIEDLLPDNYKKLAQNYTKNLHILDVWFDSGSTWSAVLLSNNYSDTKYPSCMYLEGSDQHRGWFQSSLLLSCAINFKAPFESILTHGFTIDEKSEKMSKSKGNVLSPVKIVSESGSEILRLWVALSDYQNDVKISPAILKQVGDSYLKIRNTIRFLLANTSGLKAFDFSNLGQIDIWILDEAQKVFNDMEKLFAEYDFSKAFGIFNLFITATLSGIYLDISKDSLYCDSAHSARRVAIQSVFGLLANRVLFMLAPFLTYTIDEALEYASPLIKNGANNIFELEKIDFPKGFNDNFNKSSFEFLSTLRPLFNEQVDKLKKDKTIKSSLELDLVIDSKYDDSLDLIADFLMVSNCTKDSKAIESIFTLELNGLKFNAIKSNKHKCPRCWQFRASSENGLCPRCENTVG